MQKGLTNTILIIILGLLVLAGFGAWYLYWQKSEPIKPAPFAPEPIISDQPVSDKSDLIIVDEPLSGQVISSPLEISGQARGTWFFEASFPIYLYDDQGNQLAVAIAQAKSDWMTEEFVPFEAEMEFAAPDADAGTLVFKKDNPSDLPEHDDELVMQVRFRESAAGAAITNFDQCVAAGNPIMESYPRQCRTTDGRTFVEEIEKQADCRPTGCSGQICADEEVVTTCQYLAEYDCLKYAVCERQPSGECGWTQTPEYKQCLENLK